MVWRQKTRKLFLEKLFSTYQPRKLYCGLRVEFNRSQFRLPTKPEIRIIMIGPGTGLVPFRGFVQERLLSKNEGKEVGDTILYFGCRKKSEDFIYQEIILHIWQGGRKLTPAKYEYTFNEFRGNNSMLELIQLQLGSVWLNQMLALLSGKASSLLEMPESFLKELSQYLPMSDLLRLSSTCKYVNKFYSSDGVWKPIFEKFLRSICTYSDYNQLQNNGGYKVICRKICIENKEKEHTKSLLNSDHIVMGSSQAKMFLSFNNNRFEQCNQDAPKHSQSTPLLEIEESYDLFPRANKSESRIHFDSEAILKSHSYQIVDSNSSHSLVHYSEKDEFRGRNEAEADNRSEKDLETGNCSRMGDDFYFSKSDLMRRLNHLTARAKKYDCEENYLPGDQTVKYALKYRT